MPDSLLIPPEFYFQPTFKIPYQEDLAAAILGGKHPLIPISLPDLSFESAESKPFGTIQLAWNDQGIVISAEITGLEPNKSTKGQAKSRVANRPYLEFFIDTRDMKSNKRANRFCHWFSLSLPYMQGKEQVRPELKQIGMLRSQDRLQSLSQENVHTVGTIHKKDCKASCWLSKEILNGFDPENVPSIGFFYKLFDAQQGEQLYGLGENFPYTTDPSLWPSLKLSR